MLKQIAFLLALLTNLMLFADGPSGEDLERKMWQNVKDAKWQEVENQIADCFQEAIFNGTRNRAQEILLLKNLDLSEFTLSDIKVTSGKDSFVITYKFHVDETIGGVRVSSHNWRMSVWHKMNGSWQWVTHTNFTPIPNKYQ